MHLINTSIEYFTAVCMAVVYVDHMNIPSSKIVTKMFARSIRNIPDSKIHGANMGPIWGQ